MPKSALKRLVSAHINAISGLRFEQEGSLALELFDCGLQVAYFTYGSDSLECQQFLSALPRARLGLLIDDVDLSNVEIIVRKYRSWVSNFLIRCVSIIEAL